MEVWSDGHRTVRKGIVAPRGDRMKITRHDPPPMGIAGGAGRGQRNACRTRGDQSYGNAESRAIAFRTAFNDEDAEHFGRPGRGALSKTRKGPPASAGRNEERSMDNDTWRAVRSENGAGYESRSVGEAGRTAAVHVGAGGCALRGA